MCGTRQQKNSRLILSEPGPPREQILVPALNAAFPTSGLRLPVSRTSAFLRRQVGQLTEKLRKAEIIIDVQKKVAALLGNPLPDVEPDEKS